MRAWTMTELRIFDESGARHDAQRHAHDLQDLDGERVLPPELLDLWNNGLQHMEHVFLPGTGGANDAATERVAVLSAFGDVLTRRVRHVDEHSVITRFWTFRDAVDRA